MGMVACDITRALAPTPPHPGPRPGQAQWIGARSEQEDALGFAGFDGQGSAGVVAVVADGMGGLSEGRAASRGAVAAFLASWTARPANQPAPAGLVAAMEAANQAVYHLARNGVGVGEVGTTLVAAAVCGHQLHWIAAGDSRLYLYRAADRSLTPCNEEHNLALRLWREAPYADTAADWVDRHPGRDHLISFLGLRRIPEIDRSVRPLALQDGDRLLLCSDGVDGVLRPDQLIEGLDGDPQVAADGMITRLWALQRRFQDNATVAILAYGETAAVAADQSAESIQHSPVQRARGRHLRYAIGTMALLMALGIGGFALFLLIAGKVPWPEVLTTRVQAITDQTDRPDSDEAATTNHGQPVR